MNKAEISTRISNIIATLEETADDIYVSDLLQELVVDLNLEAESETTVVQTRIVYATAIMVPVSAERWAKMSHAERLTAMKNAGMDPESQFSAGHIDANADASIEFVSHEAFVN